MNLRKSRIAFGSLTILAAFLLSCSTVSAQTESEPLVLTPGRSLHTARAVVPQGPRYLSAASGMVVRGRHFYVVADDTQILGYFQGHQALRQTTILRRPPLPAEPKLRGKLKPDFEALTLLDIGTQPQLLALCSGSGRRRNSGVLIPLLPNGRPGPPLEFDLKLVYDALRERFVDLNIEGASVVGEHLRLLQRGNSSQSGNALIDLKLAPFLLAAMRGKSVGAEVLAKVQDVDLGTVPGSQGPVRWTFTDLCPLGGGRSIFTAAAEDTDNPYEDGEIIGSALGVLEADGTVSFFRKVDQVVKLEGVAVAGDTIYLVTDSDNPEEPATLFQLKRPKEIKRPTHSK